jgi:hypothetical protein|tara:strand:- start:91 stop:369 length:279 start_codon:yes stop_codon:yes gene_type:complete
MLVGGLIKWSKLLTYQTGLFGGGYLLGRYISGMQDKPEMLKVRDYLKKSLSNPVSRLPTQLAKKKLEEGLRLTSKALNVGADLLNQKPKKKK